MFPVLGTELAADRDSVANALTNATLLRLFHSEGAAFPGEALAASLGVDNICAIDQTGSMDSCAGGGGNPVPEPGTLALLGLSWAAMRCTRRRSRS